MARNKAGMYDGGVVGPGGTNGRDVTRPQSNRAERRARHFQERETVAEFGRRRARSGLSTAGVAIMNRLSPRSPRGERIRNGGGGQRSGQRQSVTAGNGSGIRSRGGEVGGGGNGGSGANGGGEREEAFVSERISHRSPRSSALNGHDGGSGSTFMSPRVEDVDKRHFAPVPGGPMDELPPQRHANAGPHVWNFEEQDAHDRRRQSEEELLMNPHDQQHTKYDQYVTSQHDSLSGASERTAAVVDSVGEVITSKPSSGSGSGSGSATLIADAYGVPCWYYVDSSGIGQGPFDDMQMRQWYVNDFFAYDLKMKRGIKTTFQTLENIFENCLDDAFQPNFGPCPAMH